MTGATVKADTRNAQRFLDKTAKAVEKEAERVSARMALTAERRAKRLYTRRVLKVRSGLLRASVTRVRSRARSIIRWVVGASAKYAGIHEGGGTIKPTGRTRTIVTGARVDGSERRKRTSGRLLAIPLKGGPLLTRAGVARGARADQVLRQWAGGRPWSSWVSKSGKAVLARRGNERPVAVMALARSVRIPRRPVWSRVAKLINRVFAPEFKRGFGIQVERLKHGA